ncbi:hypothetical protein [Photobacterium atrarenae]|uniref:Uncharacterized protein n=1 Tax=Photobacterium atrarenae TaxID=865757 RepID=A0ABY5GJI3_9GAMM|nr:hypothetical protein [Photobacterium atrarenae]UTV28737.1 hypothetical protein NNL38_05680 [Photobacterium atrarenae]
MNDAQSYDPHPESEMVFNIFLYEKIEQFKTFWNMALSLRNLPIICPEMVSQGRGFPGR